MIIRNHQNTVKKHDCVNILDFNLGPYMRTLKYMVLALFFILLVAIVVGFFLPSKVLMQRSILIERSPEKIFNVINSLKNFNNWSPWVDKDITANYTFSGPNVGVGSKMIWDGNNQVGQGSQEIIESVENDYVKTELYFDTSQQPAMATISLKSEQNNTRVNWIFENDAGGNLLARYFGLAIEDLLAPDYEKGLANLKRYVENLPRYDYSNITIIEVPIQKIYQIEAQSERQPDKISAQIADSFSAITTFLRENNIPMNGSPKIINKSNKDNNYKENGYQFIAAIAVDNNDLVDQSGVVIASIMPHGKSIKMIHKGAYESLADSYELLNAYIYENKLSINGSSWEDYVAGPSIVEDSELITHIYQPIN
jgi:effector-binding domain-containing protein